ncbi:MAG: hypothetical protein CMF48_03155 [Legionellales bacterium]|nr:hypothetical protein [Legionellales bacterium]|tara:strand:+ start:68 stop:541 length:474 start_codon:yes stop_codon:yes gene_type:complete
MATLEEVKVYEPHEIDLDAFDQSFVSCLILTASGKLALQYRDPNFHTHSDRVCAFGGKMEEEESPDEAVVRELHEELGVKPDLAQLRYLETLSEAITQHKELIYTFFWHDTSKQSYKCTEGEIIMFDSAEAALKDKRLMPDTRWLIAACKDLAWLPK